MNTSFDPTGSGPQSLLGRIIGAVVGVIALGVALMFSAVVFVVLAVVVLALWGYFWWKTRTLRRQMQEQMRSPEFESRQPEMTGDGDIIEGEAVRLDDERNRLK